MPSHPNQPGYCGGDPAVADLADICWRFGRRPTSGVTRVRGRRVLSKSSPPPTAWVIAATHRRRRLSPPSFHVVGVYAFVGLLPNGAVNEPSARPLSHLLGQTRRGHRRARRRAVSAARVLGTPAGPRSGALRLTGWQLTAGAHCTGTGSATGWAGPLGHLTARLGFLADLLSRVVAGSVRLGRRSEGVRHVRRPGPDGVPVAVVAFDGVHLSHGRSLGQLKLGQTELAGEQLVAPRLDQFG
jgi:hypothetical protein